MGVSQENKSSYFLFNAVISKVLSDVSSIPAARDEEYYLCNVTWKD